MSVSAVLKPSLALMSGAKSLRRLPHACNAAEIATSVSPPSVPLAVSSSWNLVTLLASFLYFSFQLSSAAWPSFAFAHLGAAFSTSSSCLRMSSSSLR